MIDNTVQTLMRKTASYEFADGIRDIHHAFWILITGLYAWIAFDLPAVWLPFAEFAKSQGLLFTLLVTFVVPIGIPLLLSQLGLHLINEYVRRPWLWRNTGFIKAKAWLLPRYILFISLALSLLMFAGGALLAIQTGDVSLIVRGLYAGIGFGIVCMYAGAYIRLQIPRYRLVSLLGAAGTILITLLPMRIGLFPIVISLFWVAVLVSSGISGILQVAQQQKSFADAA